jgi:proteasome lid subunit RPN8/RPN11
LTEQTAVERAIAFLAANDEEGNELCGILAKTSTGLVAIQVPNQAEDKKNTFHLDDRTYLRWFNRGEVWGIWHTHPVGEEGFSDADLAVASVLKLPQLLYEKQIDRFTYWTPQDFKAPLVGRYYCAGVHDCYALVHDCVQRLSGEQFPDLDRKLLNTRGALADSGKLWEGTGFERAFQPKVGRVAVLSIQANGVPNHLGFMLREDLMLHHAFEQKSEIVTHLGVWKALTLYYLCHPQIESKLVDTLEVDPCNL